VPPLPVSGWPDRAAVRIEEFDDSAWCQQCLRYPSHVGSNLARYHVVCYIPPGESTNGASRRNLRNYQLYSITYDGTRTGTRSELRCV
jgi:hypothetical protein